MVQLDVLLFQPAFQQGVCSLPHSIDHLEILSLEGVSSFCKHRSLINNKNIRAISLSVKQKHQICIFGIGSKSITTRHRDKFAHYKTQIQKILTPGGLDYTTLYF